MEKKALRHLETNELQQPDSRQVGATALSSEAAATYEHPGGHHSRQRLDLTTEGEGSDDDDDTVSFGASVEGRSTEKGVGSSTNLDKYTTTRREKRLAMNRESARNRRQRKKVLVQTLEEQSSDLRKSNKELQSTNESLVAKVSALENELAIARRTIGQLASTSGMTNAAAHESASNAMSFQINQLQNQQYFQQHQQPAPQHAQLIQQQMFGPVYTNTFGGTATGNVSTNSSSMSAAAPLSFDGGRAINTSNIVRQFDPIRSYALPVGGDTGLRPTDQRQDVSMVPLTAESTQNNSIEGRDNLSRLVQTQLDHSAIQGIPSGINYATAIGDTTNATAWCMPAYGAGNVPPLSFPSMDDSFRGVVDRDVHSIEPRRISAITFPSAYKNIVSRQ
jgi:bZIP transcription factor